MQLTFEAPQLVGAGTNPAAIHTPENIVQVIFVGQNGSIYATEASTPMGEWENREFNPAYMICDDVDVVYMKLKYIASSIFVVWRNAAEVGEVVPYVPGLTHSLRHRFAVWAVRQELTKYLIDGTLDFTLDDPIVRFTASFENPAYVVSHEDTTNLTPGTSLTLFFRAGDSAHYIMGRYYVDKNDMAVSDSTTSVEGRNGIGKLLKDQTFDENTLFSKQSLHLIGVAIFEDAGIADYWVGETATERGMKFSPEMNLLEGIQELIQTTLSWKLEEDLSGTIKFGDKSDPEFIPYEEYTFTRNTDVFSRSVARDDQDAYARVCVKAEGAATSTTGTVTVGTLNLRSGPGTSYEILHVLTTNDVVNILEDLGNGWLHVTHDAFDGYVWAAYVSQQKGTTGDFYAYADVDFRFVMGRHKTLHITAAKDTSAADAQTYANEVAALLGSVGTMETFDGPFKPYLRCGDNARIITSNGPKLLGQITSVSHKFGKSGFSTTFVVDSGMKANKTKLSDYINKISGQQSGGQATRLY